MKKLFLQLTTLKKLLLIRRNKGIQNRLEIYKKDYWDKFELDDCKSQKFSNEIFDDAVNRGVGMAAYIACIVLNLPAQKKVTKELLWKLKNLY